MLDKPLNQLTFTVVDTETTGMSPKYARLLEIAAVKVKPELVIDMHDTFSQLINPQCPISYDCYRIHGISDDMVADKPVIANVIPDFAEFTKNTVLVAHNARFDMGFIECAFKESGIRPPFLGVLDTVKMAKKAYPHFKRYNLDSMIELLNIRADVRGGSRHRALFDAAHTARLLILCIKNLELMGIKYIHDL